MDKNFDYFHTIICDTFREAIARLMHANREGTPGTLEVEIIREVSGDGSRPRPREQTVWHDLNNKRCGWCGWTIQEILR